MAAMTVPAAAILRAENRYGIDDGQRSFQSTCHHVADSVCISSTASGSRLRRPRTILTSVGKKLTRLAMMTFGARPLPSQMTRMGAEATNGMERIATAIG